MTAYPRNSGKKDKMGAQQVVRLARLGLYAKAAADEPLSNPHNIKELV